MCSTSLLPSHLSLVVPTRRQGGRGKGDSLALLLSSSSSSLPTPSISATRLPISSSSSSSFGSKPAIILHHHHHFRKPSQSTTAASSTSEETEPTTATAVEEEEEKEEEQVAEEEEEEEEEAKPPRKPIIKLGDIMGILNKRAVEAAEKERPVPDIRSGDVVQIKLEVPENRRRASIYKGIVISKQNAGIHTTIRIRRIIAGIGVEIVFPVYSPNIKELKVVSHRKVRRARLYYLRDKLPRLSTFK